MMGITPAQVATLMQGAENGPLGYGGNCGTGASELMAALLNMGEAAAPADVLVAKSNCGVPAYVDGEIVYAGSPELMADYARLCRDAGVRIIGGCCGTTPAHVAAMRQALEDHEPGDRPDLERVVARLGEISKGAHQLGGDAPPPEPEGGRGGRRGARRGGRRRG